VVVFFGGGGQIRGGTDEPGEEGWGPIVDRKDKGKKNRYIEAHRH